MQHNINFDVDIDVANRVAALSGLDYVAASIITDTAKVEKHNTGVYFQDIPCDPFTCHANIDYREAEELGYLKVDFLNVHIYDDILSEEELISYMVDPDWSAFMREDIVTQLFHLSDYFWLVSKLKPTSVEELAMVLAIIRPAKRYLENSSWDEIRREVWTKPSNGKYYFKKSHSLSYAMAIVVQLNKLITAQL